MTETDDEEYGEQEDARVLQFRRTVDEKGKKKVDVEEEEEEEEEGSSDEDIRRKRIKRKKRKEDDFELDEEDYDLLQEANIIGFRRPSKDGKKVFKRLKKADLVTGGGKLGFIGPSDYEEGGDDGGRRRRTAGERLERSLFGDDEAGAPDYVPEGEEEMDDNDDEDEMADFIVYGVGEPGLSRKRNMKTKASAKAPLRSSKVQQGAQGKYRKVNSLLEEMGRRRTDTLAGLFDEEKEGDDNDDYDHGQEDLNQRLLEKQYEPSLLEEKYLTERDNRIRKSDIPERLQILEEAAGALPSSGIAKFSAADWIYDRAFGHLGLALRPEFQQISKLDKPEIVRQIENVLRLLHDEKLEVPFIGMYRREECLDLLKTSTDEFDYRERPKIQRYEELWAIAYWDKKWLLLQQRKATLLADYEKRIPVSIRNDPEKDALVKKIVRAVEEAQSEQAVDDCDSKFNLHFPLDEVDISESGFKRPKRLSLYSMCRKAGLNAVAKHFGLAPHLLGENLQATYKKHDVEDEALSLDDLAARFCATNKSFKEFRDPGSVLRAARHMVAVEISTETAVKEYVRSFYTENAVVSTRPTTDGNRAIDPFHQYAGVKWLLDKPISAYNDAQWLLIQKAEEEKLLEVTLGLREESRNKLLAECENLYLSDGVSLIAQQWNEQRKLILRDAIVTLTLPSMEKEARLVLASRAKQWLAAQCGLQLWNKVSVAPYAPGKASITDYRNNGGPSLRVLACCWGPGNPATTFVMLDGAGEITNVLYTGYLNIKAFTYEQTQRKQRDHDRLLQFVRDHRPHVVVIGAANLQCRFLSQDVLDVVFKVSEQHPSDLAESLDMIKVVYGEESIPALYENSRISQVQLPGQPGIVRRAVGLGRFLQNPVAMVASLCGPTMEVLSLKLHPLQNCLTNEELYEAIECTMVTVTNQVGIDINLAASHYWLFGVLQFIGGLGPRKAGVVQRAIQTAGRLRTRKDLFMTLKVMGKKVFINSAGFIRVCGSGEAASETQDLNPLDDTRIHPESYQVAKTMAEAAYKEKAQQNGGEIDEDLLQMAVEHVLTNPSVLDTLTIEDYALHTQDLEQYKKISTLELIKSELQHGFQEWRQPYAEATEEDCFFLLSGENEDTLFPGRIVHATVRKVQQYRVMCVLESGLLGFIQKEDLSDDGDIEPKDKVAEGNIVTCRVKDVVKEKYLVNLICRDSDLQGDFWDNQLQRDKYYVQDTTFLQNEQEKARKKREEDERKEFKPRIIVHPYFQNISMDDALKALMEKEVGDAIIRPSVKGPTHLSLTLKIHDGLHTHIDIAEGGKDNRDLKSFLSLGKTLTIGEEYYKDLDEVVARYIDPLVEKMRQMMGYRKYKQGTKQEVDDALRSEKADNPKRIPYYFSLAHEHPGAFLLSYIRVADPLHEYISVSPTGFRFRKKNFDTVEKIVTFFQKHFNDPILEPLKPGGFGSDFGERGRGGRRGRGRGRGRGRENDDWGDRGDGNSSWESGRGRGRGRGRGWGRGRFDSENGGSNSDWKNEDSFGGGWGKSGGSGGDGWGNDNNAGASSQGGGWGTTETATVTTNLNGRAWDSTNDGGGGDNWGDKGGTTNNTAEANNSAWGSLTDSAGGGGGGGWDAVDAVPESGGWDSVQGGEQPSGVKDGGGIQSGRGSKDISDWGQSGGHGQEKSSGWGAHKDKTTSMKEKGSGAWDSLPDPADGGGGWDAVGVSGGQDAMQGGEQTGDRDGGHSGAGRGGQGQSDWGLSGGRKQEFSSGWGVDNDKTTTTSTKKDNGGWDSMVEPAAVGGGWDAVQGGEKSGDGDGGGGHRNAGHGSQDTSGRGQSGGQKQESSSGWGADNDKTTTTNMEKDNGGWDSMAEPEAGGGGWDAVQGGEESGDRDGGHNKAGGGSKDTLSWGQSGGHKQESSSGWGADKAKTTSNRHKDNSAWDSPAESAGLGGGWEKDTVQERGPTGAGCGSQDKSGWGQSGERNKQESSSGWGADKDGSTGNVAKNNSAWDTVTESAGGGGGGWDVVTESAGGDGGGWDSVAASDGWGEKQGSRNEDRDGDRNQGGWNSKRGMSSWGQSGGRGQDKSNDWGGNQAPAWKPAQDSWNDRRDTPAWGRGRGNREYGRRGGRHSGGDWGSDRDAQNSSGGRRSGGDWGTNRDTQNSSGGRRPGGDWVSDRDTQNSSGRGDRNTAKKSSGWGDGKDCTEKSSGWGDGNAGKTSSGRGESRERSTGSSGWGEDASAGKSSGWGDDVPGKKSSGTGQGEEASGRKSSGWGDDDPGKRTSGTGWGEDCGAVKSSGWGDGDTQKKSGTGWGEDAGAGESSGWGEDASAGKSSGWGDGGTHKQSSGEAGWGEDAGAGKSSGWVGAVSGKKSEDVSAGKSSDWGNTCTQKKSSGAGRGEVAGAAKASGWGDGESGKKPLETGWGEDVSACKSSGWGDSGAQKKSSGAGWGDNAGAAKASGWGAGDSAKKPSGTGWGEDGAAKASAWGEGESEKQPSGTGWGEDASAGKSCGWGDSVAQKKPSGTGWGDNAGAAESSGWGDTDSGKKPSGTGWGEDGSAGKPADTTVKSGGTSGWDTAETKENEPDGPDWGAISPRTVKWGSGSGESAQGWEQQETAPGRDGGWNSRPSRGGWGSDRQDRGDRGYGDRGRGERGNGGRGAGERGRGSRGGRGGRWPNYESGPSQGWD